MTYNVFGGTFSLTQSIYLPVHLPVIGSLMIRLYECSLMLPVLFPLKSVCCHVTNQWLIFLLW